MDRFCSLLYFFLAQAELLATVIPGFPVIAPAGLISSTLWLVWVLLTGIQFIKIKPRVVNSNNGHLCYDGLGQLKFVNEDLGIF